MDRDVYLILGGKPSKYPCLLLATIENVDAFWATILLASGPLFLSMYSLLIRDHSIPRIIAIINIITVSLLVTPSLTPGHRAIGLIPNFVFYNMTACRVYRNTRLENDIWETINVSSPEISTLQFYYSLSPVVITTSVSVDED